MPIHQMSLAVLLRAACASMSTTTRDRGDRYGPMEWAQKPLNVDSDILPLTIWAILLEKTLLLA